VKMKITLTKEEIENIINDWLYRTKKVCMVGKPSWLTVCAEEDAITIEVEEPKITWSDER